MAHDHKQHQASLKNIRIAFFLNVTFTIFEIIGGFLTNSVAILSDAVHDLGDSLSLGTSWYLQSKSGSKADNTFTFGYARFSLLGALINSVVLLAGSTYVIYHAVQRLIEPESSNADGMILFAIIGIVVNGYAAWRLSSGTSMNERVVSWHLLEDVLGWVAVLIVGIVLQFKDVQYLDPALSLFITAYILWNTVKRLRETLYIFLQGAPEKIDLVELRQNITSLDNIADVHHMHVWSLEGQEHVFTAHIKLKHINSFKELLRIKKSVKDIIRKYPVKHVTIETELDEETCFFDENKSED